MKNLITNITVTVIAALTVNFTALATTNSIIVTNVTAAQQSGTKLVSIYYDVFDADGDNQSVSVAVSTNSGASFNLAAASFSGDVGESITTGTNKQIVWDAGIDWNWNYSSNLRFKVTASESDVPHDMALIPAGSFQMGDTFSEGQSDELPLHEVYLDAFYMDKFKVSNEKMREVMQWAFDNGKITATVSTVTNLEGDQQELLDLDDSDCQISFSNNIFVVDLGKMNFPCIEITWFGSQAYCNYKSDMEELERCIMFTNWSCNWNANGYRLPTEAEREKAARGGAPGTRFPWSDTNIITHGRANYYSDDYYSYDVSTTRGYNPAFTNGGMPYTSPEGYFAANDYELYDMAGNGWEWNNDWYLGNWYSQEGATKANTRGPASGSDRVVRAGTWGGSAFTLRCGNRFSIAPLSSFGNIGFRCVRPVSVVPHDMALIPAGSFQMGDTFSEGQSDELPLHEVYLDAFYMDKFKVSNEKMREVMQWAFDNGKITATVSTVTNLEGDQQELLDLDDSDCQISFSNNNTFVVDLGKINFPCIEITWYGSQAYCNYKSDMEGFERSIAFTNWSCNWNANGYRLPTEAEWEKAARGGAPGTRFPWSDTNIITHARANYYSSNSFSYDVSLTRGYNPAFTNGVMPYTSPVGYFAANNYGLYDMAGNVWEWNNDWYLGDWYSQPDATNANTRGPASGYSCMIRGGAWYHIASYARCAERNFGSRLASHRVIGFRCARPVAVVLPDMALIPAGSFQMGDTFGEGWSDELPLHDVYIDSFYMDKFEVSNEKMREVMQWAFDNGKITATVATVTNLEGDQKELLDVDSSYCQISFSNNIFVVDAGKSNYPCVAVSWYGSQAYCNYKSDMEGFERCIAFTNWSCNWNANGYRLPTESEWEKAGRGGVAGTRFPWSDTNIITHARANYYSYWSGGSPQYSYDHAIRAGYNPAFTNGVMPYTSPVGYFAANDYGLYDMAGNVGEWNNDWYDNIWYSQPGATNANTRGPDTDTYCVVRGGDWTANAPFARCAYRRGSMPAFSWRRVGFRCVRPVSIARTGFDVSPDTLVNTLDLVPLNAFVLINNGATLTRFTDAVVTNLTHGATWVDTADNPAFSPCITNPYAPSFAYILPAEGTNVVHLRYRDVIGGVYVTNLWIVLDTIPPTVPILVLPTNSSYLSSATALLEWENGIDSNGIAGVEVEFNGSPIFPGVTNKLEYAVAFNSTNDWRVLNFDTAGNTSEWSETWQFFVVPEPGILWIVIMITCYFVRKY